MDGGHHREPALHAVQADVLGVPISRPVVAETTALGAAYAAGCAAGFWSGEDELRRNWCEGRRWEPQWDEERRRRAYADWKKAVSADWAAD